MKFRLPLLALPAFVTALLAVQFTDRYQTAQQIAKFKKQMKLQKKIIC